jgi:uncharacterized Zn finger protein (UPF0148 family)
MSSSSVPLQNLFASLFAIPQSGTSAQQQMEDIFRNITNRQQAPDTGPSSSIEQNTNNSQSALISAFRDYNHNIGEFIYYNYNTQQLRDYNTNVKNFVELIRMQNRFSQPNRRSYAASATARPVHTQTSYNRRLTDRQIRDAVRNVFYDETVHTEPRCPITLADFENGESISQIITCGHIFKREPLAQHFHRGERFCPMCRIDVTATSDSNGHSNREQSDSTNEETREQRNNTGNNTSNTSNTANTTNEESFMTTMPLSELSQFLSSNPTLQDFSRLFQNSQTTTAASSTDATNPSNLIFQFEIPISAPEID